MMKPTRIQIFIINAVGRKITLIVDLEDTIKKVKELYLKKTNEKIESLIYINKVLIDDELKLKDYGIHENSDLFANKKLKGGKS